MSISGEVVSAGLASDGGDDVIEHFGVNLGYAMERDGLSLNIRVDYISSLGDSDTLREGISADPRDYVPGIALHAAFEAGPWRLFSEYLTATDRFTGEALSFAGNGAEPGAYYAEAGYTFDWGNRPTTISAGYQRTEEALALELPESRIMLGLSRDILDGVTLGFEWAHDEDYSQAEGGTDKSADGFTAQLAVEF